MTVPVQTPINSYVYAGSPSFIYSFQLLAATDLLVTVDGVVKTLGVDYTVAGVGVQAGGTIAYLTTITTGQLVSLSRQTTIGRSTDYQTLGDFLAGTINNDFDRLWMALQERVTNDARSVRVPAGETLATLPAAASRAGLLLGFNGAGGLALIAAAAQSATALALSLLSNAGATFVNFLQAGVGAVLRTVQDKLRDELNVKDFGAKGDWNGSTGTDDTAAINACFEAARLAGRIVYFPAGTYSVTNLLYGTQSTSGQSSAPLGIRGEGLGTTIAQKAGSTGTVLKALGIGGSTWEGFTVDAGGNANQCIDTSYGNAGPSLHNEFRYIRCANSAITPANGAIWKATNNNDCGFRHVWTIGVNAAVANQVGLDYTASGGNNNLTEVYCVNSWLRLGVQNGVVHGGWVFGVVLAAGSENLVRFSGTQFFQNATLLAHVLSESFATFASTKALNFDTCWFISTGVVTSVFNVNLYSSLLCEGCNFPTSAATNLLGANCRSDSSASVAVRLTGGESSSSLTLNDVGSVRTVARDFNNNTTGLNFNKNWSGTLTVTIAGLTIAGTASYTNQTISWVRDGNTVTYSGRVTWSGHTGTGQMSLQGLSFTQVVAGPVALNYTGGSAGVTFANPVVVQPTLPTIQFWLAGGGAQAVVATGDIIISGSCVVLP